MMAAAWLSPLIIIESTPHLSSEAAIVVPRPWRPRPRTSFAAWLSPIFSVEVGLEKAAFGLLD